MNDQRSMFGQLGQPPQGYGAAPLKPPAPGPSPGLSPIMVIASLFAPCVVFAAVSACMSLGIRYAIPVVAWSVVVLGGAAAGASWALLGLAVLKRMKGDRSHDTFWPIFLAAFSTLALVLGLLLGQANWTVNTMPFHALSELTVRTAVDTTNSSGLEFMDAGQVYFVNGTTLQTDFSEAFKNSDTYCVAPITGGSMTAKTSFDFWAVGLNCCSNNTFTCSDAADPSASGGLRLIREDQAEYYFLAIKQAEAKYGIVAQHPLLFFWVSDPESEMQSYQADADQFYLFGLVMFCAGQLFAVIVGIVVYTKPEALLFWM